MVYSKTRNLLTEQFDLLDGMVKRHELDIKFGHKKNIKYFEKLGGEETNCIQLTIF